jgi:hypothetical protein
VDRIDLDRHVSSVAQAPTGRNSSTPRPVLRLLQGPVQWWLAMEMGLSP